MTDTALTEAETRIRTQPAYVVLGRKPGDNAWKGVVEHSFSMALDANYVRRWWTGTAVDNFFGATWEIDGLKDANAQRDYYAKLYPDMEFIVFDVHDEEAIPVILDWDHHVKSKDKFNRRNMRFEMK